MRDKFWNLQYHRQYIFYKKKQNYEKKNLFTIKKKLFSYLLHRKFSLYCFLFKTVFHFKNRGKNIFFLKYSFVNIWTYLLISFIYEMYYIDIKNFYFWNFIEITNILPKLCKHCNLKNKNRYLKKIFKIIIFLTKTT